MTRSTSSSSSASRISRSFGAGRRRTPAPPLSSARSVALASGPSPIRRTQVGPVPSWLSRSATLASMAPVHPRSALLQRLQLVALPAGLAGVDRLAGGVDDVDRDVEAPALRTARLGPSADGQPRLGGQVVGQGGVELRGP